MNHSKRFKNRCWHALSLWVLCSFSTTLLAASPSVEQRDGFIALCTAQGIKWIPINAFLPSSTNTDIETTAQSDSGFTGLSSNTEASTTLNTIGTQNTEHAQLSQHCTACLLSSIQDSDQDVSSLGLSNAQHDFLQTKLIVFSVCSSVTTPSFASQIQPRAPPLGII